MRKDKTKELEFTEEQLDRQMLSASDTLDYIKTEAVPFIQMVMEDFIKNDEIQIEGKRIVACFGYHSPRSILGTPKKTQSMPRPRKAKADVGPSKEYMQARRVTFSNVLDVNAIEIVELEDDGSQANRRRHSFCVGDIKKVQQRLEDDEMGKAVSRAVDDSNIKYQCPIPSAPYEDNDVESSQWKVPMIKVNEWRTVEEDDHGYERVVNIDHDTDGVEAVSPPKPERGNLEEDTDEDDDDEDTNAYEKVETVDEQMQKDANENDYTELEALMAQLAEIAGHENAADLKASEAKDYDLVFDGAEESDVDGYEVPMTEEEVLKSRSSSMEYLVHSMEEDDFGVSLAILFGELGEDDDGYEKIEIGAQEACPSVAEVDIEDESVENKVEATEQRISKEDEEETMDDDISRFSEYSEIDIVEALVKSGLMNAHKDESNSGQMSSSVDSNESRVSQTVKCEVEMPHTNSGETKELASMESCEESVFSDESTCMLRTEDDIKVDMEQNGNNKESCEMETSESDISNADDTVNNVNENEEVKPKEKKDDGDGKSGVTTRSFKKSMNSTYQSITANLLRKKRSANEKRQGSVFGEDMRIENVNFRGDSLDSDDGYQDSGDFKETTCSDVNNSFGFPAPAAEDGQSVDLEYASDSSTGQNGLCDDPVYDNVCMDDDDNLDRNVFNSSPVSSVSATFTEGSEDAVQEDKQETKSMGSLENICSLGELRVRNVISKSIHCLPSGDRQLMKEAEEDLDTPPKPRRTWYYRSSADVRKSLIRSFGLDADGIMRNPTYAQVSKPNTRVIHGSLPGRSNHGSGHRAMKRIPLTLSRHSKMIYKERFSSKSSKLGRNTSHDSGVLTGDEDSRSTIRDNEIYSQSHLYEEVATVTRDGDRSGAKSEVRKTLTMDEDTTETTYEVCTHWVNDQTSEAIGIFDRLTKKLVSPYSIIPMVREVEGIRRKSLGNAIEQEEENIDFPAWTSILNVLAADE
ncbi:serine-aspartate repeat-containing protein F-like [Lytechinus pictus]|uniref:serine-aspartate repeat-containing protein F-like n=1 Tax=Lytechinus pictus TaxID=7653 RepID=UPI0030B9EC4E